ncbi:MAG: molybdate ABC transporter substrate-binding protein [Myxococcota bacterium]
MNPRITRLMTRDLFEVGRRLVLALFVGLFLASCPQSSAEVLVVHAPASLAEVMPAIARGYERATGNPVQVNVASTARLVSQLTAGAPGDVFLSADSAWMDHLEGRGDLAPSTRRDLLGNALVVAIPVTSTLPTLSRTELVRFVSSASRVAVAQEGVPAGRYGRAALRSLGLDLTTMPPLLHADDVRTALSWVALSEVDAALVYETDARAEPRVRVVYRFGGDDHPPIVYPVAVLGRSERRAAAEAFVAFCEREEARALFSSAGFLPAPTRVP